MPAFATDSGQGWPPGPVATHLSASGIPDHFSFQPSSINPTPPQTWPASTSRVFDDTGLPCFTSIGDESSYHALLSGNFGGTSDVYAAQSMLPSHSNLPQLHGHRAYATSSTQPLLTDLQLPPQSGSIGYSCPGSPTLSRSPSLGEDHKPTHARRPAKLNLFNLSSVPELQNLASSIQGEAWFLNGEEERVISEREAERNLGPAGHSIFIAFLQEVVDLHTKRKTGWECRICWAANDAGAGDRYEVERLDRALKHVRHHFSFKKFHCGGTCGELGWYGISCRQGFQWMLTMVIAVAVTCDLLVRLPLLPINVEKRPRPAPSGKWCLFLNDTPSFAHPAFSLVEWWSVSAT